MAQRGYGLTYVGDFVGSLNRTVISQGCFTDAINNRIFPYVATIASDGLRPADVTPASCQAACAAASYLYSGVEWTLECYCSNSPPDPARYVDAGTVADTSCNFLCAGNRTLACGGANRIAVYHTTDASPPVAEKVVADSHAKSPYDLAVLADSPSAYWPLNDAAVAKSAVNYVNQAYPAIYSAQIDQIALPNGDTARLFDGLSQYFQANDSAEVSPFTNSVMTFEAWMSPSSLVQKSTEGDSYVHWAGKGTSKQQEYASRMYSSNNRVGRGNRISGYLFNLVGGLGVGSYIQDVVQPREWIHYVLILNPGKKTTSYPNGYTMLYKNGIKRDQDNLMIAGTGPIINGRGTAPFRAGTRDMKSFFGGGIGKLAFYPYELNASQVLKHYQIMTAA